MEVIAALGAWALGPNFTSNVVSSVNEFTIKLFAWDPQSQFLAHMPQLLSPDANIYFPGSPKFAEAILRWQEWENPNITVVVEATTERDVIETVRQNAIKSESETKPHKILYSIWNVLPVLAVTSGHGAISSLGAVENGIQIWMRQMNSITIDPDGTTATIGGGVLTSELVDTLWAAKKYTVTGACGCTGVVGPMLGGGHGLLQGHYGLLSDNLVSARLVLPNATALTVSAESNPDLFWAIRGAGHNFGIVTEFTYKIYDVPPDDRWVVEFFIYTGDKVEALYEQLNTLAADGPLPPELITFSFFAWEPEIDTTKPCIFFFLIYQGMMEEQQLYSPPFHAIGPRFPVQARTVTYPEVSKVTGNGDEGLACSHGTTSLRFPVGLMEYNVKAQRAVYEKFKQVTSEYPALNKSFFLFEGWSTNGVKSVPEESSAFPHRQDNLLLSPVMVYTPNATLDAIASKAGKEIRQILHDASGSSELHAYVNYAYGEESVEEMYGYEDWRQKKLKALKTKYDEQQRFNFYAPVKLPLPKGPWD